MENFIPSGQIQKINPICRTQHFLKCMKNIKSRIPQGDIFIRFSRCQVGKMTNLSVSLYLTGLATSLLVTDVGDEICWWQLWDVGFGRFCHQHPLSFNISVGHQHPKDVTNIEILSLTCKNYHQDKVTNIYLSSTSL